MKKISKLRGMQVSKQPKLILWKTASMKFPKVMAIKR